LYLFLFYFDCVSEICWKS